MNLQALGRSQLRKMIKMAGNGADTVTFRFFDSMDYDPNTGTGAGPASTQTVTCFAAKGESVETKQGSVIQAEYVLYIEDGVLTRLPSTQDEVIMNGISYKVACVGDDPMGVCLRVGLSQA